MPTRTIEVKITGHNTAGPAFSQLNQQLGQAQQHAGALNSAMSTMAGVLGGMAIYTGIASIGQGLASAVRTGMQFNSTLQQASLAFETMLGSMDLAQAHMQELRAFAKETPFSFTGLVEQSKRLQAYGFEAERVIPILRTLTDATAAMGGGEASINRVTLALGQMQARGKVATQEMNQLTEVGIPAWDMLAEKLGVTRAKLQEMVESGAVPAQQAIDALLTGMEDRFGGLGVKMAGTWAGVMNNLGDVTEQIFGQVVEPVFTRLGASLKNALAALDTPEVQEFTQNVATGIGEALDAIGSGAGKMAGLVQTGLSTLSDVFGESAQSAFSWGVNIVDSLAAGIINAAACVLSTAMSVIASVLSFWLEPGSPPRVAPDLPDWGARAMEEYLQGFTQADFGILNEVGSLMRTALEAMVSGLEIEKPEMFRRLLDAREDVASLIDQFRQFGAVTEEALERASSGFGNASGAMREYILSQLELVGTADRMREANERLEQSQERLRLAQDAVADAQERLNDLGRQSKMMGREDRATELSFRRRRMELERMRPLEEKDAKGRVQNTAAIEAWRRAQEALRREEEEWRLGRDEQRYAMELQRDAIEDEIDSRQEAVKAEQAQVEANRRAVDSIREEERAVRERAGAQRAFIQSLADTARIQEELAKAMEPKGGGGGGGGAGIAGGLGNIQKKIEDQKAGIQNAVKEAFFPLTTALENLRNAFPKTADAAANFGKALENLKVSGGVAVGALGGALLGTIVGGPGLGTLAGAGIGAAIGAMWNTIANEIAKHPGA